MKQKVLTKAIHNFLKDWCKQQKTKWPILTQLQLYQRKLALKMDIETRPRLLIETLLQNTLDLLAKEDKESALLLRQRFIEGKSPNELKAIYHIEDSHYFRKQKKAITHLSEILLSCEKKFVYDHYWQMESRLEPPSYDRLFGLSTAQQQLGDLLLNNVPPWIISIDGLGGIGKTSLAHSVVSRLLKEGHFFDIAWVSAKQQTFSTLHGIKNISNSALSKNGLVDALLEQLYKAHPLPDSPQERYVLLLTRLKNQPHLVVVDNLETVVDYEVLLPTLHQLANPTKILLTSRHRLQSQTNVYSFSLQELNETDTLAFLHHQAKARHLTSLQQTNEDNLKQIYEIVGGNPLALKLLLGQIAVLPLARVLESLKLARGKTIADLYRYIYWEAWHLLTKAARQILLTMPLSKGGTLQDIARESTVTGINLDEALQQLTTLSLLEVSGPVTGQRYFIHRLTETFLLEEVLKWQT